MYLKGLRNSFFPASAAETKHTRAESNQLQPDVRLCVINTISRLLELRLLNGKESVIYTKMTRVNTVDVNKTTKEHFP